MLWPVALTLIEEMSFNEEDTKSRIVTLEMRDC